ncbi:MAG: hypothetical protein IJ737_02835 [Ruminococcus sp.]|nr:hypothetical protein [Ruminococcus sp.]
MKGLIYRRFYLTRKNIILSAAVLVGVIIFEVLICLSFKYGNLARVADPDDVKATVGTFCLIIVTMITLSGFASEHGLLASDIKANYDMYSYTIPISEEKKALVHIGFMFTGAVLGLVVAVLNCVLVASLGVMSMGDVKIYAVLSLVIAVMFSLLECIKAPLIIRLRKENTATAAAFGVTVAVYIVGMMAFSGYYRNKYALVEDGTMTEVQLEKELLASLKRLGLTVGWVLPILLVGMYVLSYLFMVKFLKRRRG